MYGPGFGRGFTHVFAAVAGFAVTLIIVAVIAFLVFLLIRYLLVATRAAQLYVSQHEPTTAEPMASPAPDARSSTASGPAPSTVTTPVTAPKKPRTPKTPPSTDL